MATALSDGIRSPELRQVAYDPLVLNLRQTFAPDALKAKIASMKTYLSQPGVPAMTVGQIAKSLIGEYNLANYIPMSQLQTLVNSGEAFGAKKTFGATAGVNPLTIDYLNRILGLAQKGQAGVESAQAAVKSAKDLATTLQSTMPIQGLSQIAAAQQTPFDPTNFSDPAYIQKAKMVKNLQRLLPDKVKGNLDKKYIRPGTVAAYFYNPNFRSNMRQLQQSLLRQGISLNDKVDSFRRLKPNVASLVPQTVRSFGNFSTPDMQYFKANYKPAMLDRKQKLSNYQEAISQNLDTLLKKGRTQQFIRTQQKQKIDRNRALTKLSQFDTKQRQLKDINTIWPQAVRAEVTWNNVANRWVGLTKLGTRFLSNPDPVAGYAKRQDMATYLLNTQLSEEKAVAQMPTLLKQLLRDNQQYSKYGIGPVGKNSLSLYVGRYYDPVSARVRMAPQANRKMVNKMNWNSVNDYYIVRTMNKWNEYVQAQQDYERHQTVKASYNQKMIQKEARSLAQLQSGSQWQKVYDSERKYWLNFSITPSQMLPYYKAVLKATLEPIITAFLTSTDSAESSVLALDNSLKKVMNQIATGSRKQVQQMFSDDFQGRQNKIKTVRWLNSKTGLVQRKVLSTLLAKYKNTFNMNGANSQQVVEYRQKLAAAQSMMRNLQDKQYSAFTKDPLSVATLDDIFNLVGMRGKLGNNTASITGTKLLTQQEIKDLQAGEQQQLLGDKPMVPKPGVGEEEEGS